MLAKPMRREGIRVFREFPVKIALIAGLAPALLPVAARAQVNIDAGKSSAEIYASDCATCHKTPRGLAVGKNSLTLSSFLREHYTASRDQASALAAYVLGAGGTEPVPKQKPEVEHARAEEPKTAGPKAGELKPGEPKTGEPKTGEPKTGEAKPGEAKPGQPKTAAHPIRAAVKPEDRRAREEDAKQVPHPAPAAAETASPEAKREPEEAAPIVNRPAPIAAVPAKDEPSATAATPSASSAMSVTALGQPRSGSDLPSLELGSSLSAVAPTEDRSSATETVPRDHIPD